jgi:hypothetical protein
VIRHSVRAGGTERRSGLARRLSTETKAAFNTTEFWAMVGVVAGILVAAAAIKGGDTAEPMSQSPARRGGTWRLWRPRT